MLFIDKEMTGRQKPMVFNRFMALLLAVREVAGQRHLWRTCRSLMVGLTVHFEDMPVDFDAPNRLGKRGISRKVHPDTVCVSYNDVPLPSRGIYRVVSVSRPLPAGDFPLLLARRGLRVASLQESTHLLSRINLVGLFFLIVLGSPMKSDDTHFPAWRCENGHWYLCNMAFAPTDLLTPGLTFLVARTNVPA